MIVLRTVKPVRRTVRFANHFERRTKEHILSIEDPQIRKRLRRLRRERPYGHDVLTLKCGHALIRPCPSSSRVIWPKQVCKSCTTREQERLSRDVAVKLKNRRRDSRATRAAKKSLVLKLVIRPKKG